MFNFLKSNPPQLIAIDISSAAVKLLELSKHGEKYSVVSYAVVPLPKGAVVEKYIKNRDTVVETIRAAVEAAKPSGKIAVVALADSSVITKIVEVDARLNEDDIEHQVVADAGKFVPYPLAEVSIDFDILGPSPNRADSLEVLVVASRSEHVAEITQVVEEAGLTVKIVDVESYAIERVCGLLRDELPNRGVDKTVAIVDVGATMTTLTVLYNLSTIFSREDMFGGQKLTEYIQQRYGMSYAEAGFAKKTGDLPEDYKTEILEPFKESIVLHVRRALQYFYSAGQKNGVDHLILSGGTMSTPGIVEMIQEKTGITAALANPFANMDIHRKVIRQSLLEDAHALMICCGLALRSFMPWH